MIEDNNNNLIWLDLEMTGLGDEHVILEVAIIITDEKLNIVDRFGLFDSNDLMLLLVKHILNELQSKEDVG